MKKLLALTLVVVFFVSLISPVSASAATAGINIGTYTTDIETVVARVKAESPGSEVFVEDNIIYVIVQDPSEIPGFSYSARTALEEYPEGGSYRSFHTTAFATFYPYSQVYMPASVVDAYKLAKLEPAIVSAILSYIAEGIVEYQIVKLIAAEYGKVVAASTISQIGNIGTAILSFTLSYGEYFALCSAEDGSDEGKVSVVRGYTAEGYEQYYYYAWNDNYCPAFNGYNATWFRGVYDVPQSE